MIEPALALQSAIRSRLVAASAVTSLVPATSILDRNSRPEGFPCILLGEGQTVPDDGIARNRHESFLDLHIWTEEAGTVAVKSIAQAIRTSLFDAVWSIPGLHVADMHITSARFMRDPDGLHAHAVIAISARTLETA